MEEPSAEEATSNSKTPQSSVISTYRAKIGGLSRNVTVAWGKSQTSHTLCVTVDKPNNVCTVACKVDLKPWPFWGKLKGSKSVDVDSRRVDIFWNLRAAKFSESAEPSEGYFIAVVADAEVVLLVGDLTKKAYRKTKSRRAAEHAALVIKKETVLGKKCFNARTKFDEKEKEEHDIVVVHSISGQKDPEMWISIDGTVSIHVANLKWKFRGNGTVWVEKVPVQVLWDVHDWLFKGHGVGQATFIFKPGVPPPPPPAADAAAEEDEAISTQCVDDDDGDSGGNSLRSSCGGDGFHEFCFFLYAWKTE
ncbi:hypothetical protein Cni_G03960 [Canna indica]|uniref:DUF868 family protein n=1 Tax=Canna indica TaxID=4628 RepID=A0AAQ3JS06_9LILI|nr:hypothetical protein Cni_G03960 [Canna indica]